MFAFVFRTLTRSLFFCGSVRRRSSLILRPVGELFDRSIQFLHIDPSILVGIRRLKVLSIFFFVLINRQRAVVVLVGKLQNLSTWAVDGFLISFLVQRQIQCVA